MDKTVTKTAAGDSTMTAVVLLWFIGALQSGNWAMSMEVAVASTGLLTRIIDAIKDWIYLRHGAPIQPITPMAAPAAAASLVLYAWWLTAAV